jgi:hypothetical protein
MPVTENRPMSRHPQPSTHFELHPQLAQDTVPVIELALCEVRLMDDANHPWLVLVPRITDMVELIDLFPRSASNSQPRSMPLRARSRPCSSHTSSTWPRSATWCRSCMCT